MRIRIKSIPRNAARWHDDGGSTKVTKVTTISPSGTWQGYRFPEGSHYATVTEGEYFGLLNDARNMGMDSYDALRYADENVEYNAGLLPEVTVPGTRGLITKSGNSYINQGVIRDANRQRARESGALIYDPNESQRALAIQRELDRRGNEKLKEDASRGFNALLGMASPSTYYNITHLDNQLSPKQAFAVDLGSALLTMSVPAIARSAGKKATRNISNKGLRTIEDVINGDDLIIADNSLNSDALAQQVQFDNYLRTGIDSHAGLKTAIPNDLKVTDYHEVPEYITNTFENSVFPRMVEERPWLNSEDFLRSARTRINKGYSVAPELTLRISDKNGKPFPGVYYPSTDRIVVQEGKEAFALPHEFRHRLDNGIELTQHEENLLKSAFGEDFEALKELKGFDTSSMADEMVTTNLDTRNILLGARAERSPLAKQNMLIDRAPDEEIVNALRNSNGYGKALVKYLESNGKLTPERVKAFREALKYVGGAAAPVGIGVEAMNQKSTGGPLYLFSFSHNPYWKTPIVRY